MPNIIIREIDETVPSLAVSDITDIAFVPGIADTNNNCYIVTGSNKPTEATQGTPTEQVDGAFTYDYSKKLNEGEYPSYYINTDTKEEWVCTGKTSKSGGYTFTWKPCDYVEPCPENIPTLCSSLTKFEELFGKTPYKWTEEQEYPTFHSKAGVDGKLMYKAGDYEKSYIIARELIGRGLPVLYCNIVSRDSNGIKKAPTVIETYNGIKYCYTKPDLSKDPSNKQNAHSDMYVGDRGTYSVKYLTSGAYPTFELIGGTKTTEKLDVTEERRGTLVIKPSNVPILRIISLTMDGTQIDNPSFDVESGEVTFSKPEGYSSGKKFDIAYTYGEPSYIGLSQMMIDTAKDRGDAVALIDHANNPSRELYGNNSVFNSINEKDGIKNGEYGAMFTPWGFYEALREREGVTTTQVLPASFGYLNALAQSIKSNDNWLAIAGVARGYVPQLKALDTVGTLSNTIADHYQPKTTRSMNAITNVRPYGLTIYSNRTLKYNNLGLSALSNLNIRNLVSDIKKTVYKVAKSLVFEQNTDILWVNFKNGISGILDRMMSGQGIESYKIIRETSDSKEKVRATIKIVPIRPVEDFEIDIVLTDSTVEVTAS